MKYIETNWDIPYYNFALEDYLLNEVEEDDYVFFYIHKPSIIVGKYQNTIEEVNKDFIDDNNIIVARRLSGGGAVYHDHGNLNFSFVHKASKKDVNDFKKFTKPVVDALKDLGLNAHLSGRNDILIDDKKISGNAQYFTNSRLLHHGTLLYDSEMSNLVKSLKVRDLKIKSKGIKSVKSRVANIADFLNDTLPIEDFRDYLLKSFYKSKDIEKYELDEKALTYIENKVKEQFSTWDWNWGKSPDYEIQCLVAQQNISFGWGRISSINNCRHSFIDGVSSFL
ncbi:MAG: lipoate--protein ligase [Tissierellales bacterium]|nr:lipoate--protein ligase [Tissierellales bacterium]